MNLDVLPHDFSKLQPPNLYKNFQEYFWQAGKLFSAENLFKGYIFGFLGVSIGRYVFEQFARETNLKKKRSVSTK